MSAQIRRRGRHVRRYTTLRMIGGSALLVVLIAAVFLTGALAQPMPSQASTRPRPVVYALRYVPHTQLCARWQAGAWGLVYGDGKPFEVVCEPIHPPRMYGWDAENW